jgi:CRP/FNR family transcriptional regulator, cyclic AMP receptor protein
MRTAVHSPVLVQTLAGVQLFRELDATRRRSVEQRCAWRRWSAGEHILDREAASNDVYFIVHGRVRVIEYSLSGKREVVLDDILPGGFFGELAAIDGEPRSANIVAVEETLTASLSAAAFADLLFEHREVGLALMCRLTEMVRASTQRIVELSTRDAQNRVYAELLRLAKTGGGLEPNTAIIQPVPVHSDIAARISTTRETVARAMSDLAHRNLVRKTGRGLLILDVEQLTSLLAKAS